MAMMERLFQLMKEKNASDMFFAVNSPVHIKINGNLIPINQQKLDADNIRSLLSEIAGQEQWPSWTHQRAEHGYPGAQPRPLPPVGVPPARLDLGGVPLRARATSRRWPTCRCRRCCPN
jgi:hypothetical protein